MTADEIQIATQPPCHRFSYKTPEMDLPQLESRLREHSETNTVEIKTLDDVLLDTKGLVQGEHRLTTTGLSQLCSALAPGLSQAIASISGLRRKEHEEDKAQAYSSMTAIKMLNALIRLRFDVKLLGQNLVIDTGNKQVEGLVSPRYCFFSNVELLERVREFAETQRPAAQFHHASLAGRRLIVRFTSATRLFSIPTPAGTREPFYAGWHFSNSEIGDGAVRASMALIRKWTGGVGLYNTGKVVHVKGDFGAKFATLLDQLQAKAAAELARLDLAEAAETMQNTSLRLGGDGVAHEKRKAAIMTKLSRGNILRDICRKIVYRVITEGSYKVDRICIDGTPYEHLAREAVEVISRRSLYDLYNSLTYYAGAMSPEQQETAEQLAYRFFTGRQKIN